MRVIGCYEDGGMAELISVAIDKLCPVPANLSLEVAALGEPMSIAMQAVNRGRPVAGETALVLGCGPIGVLATLYLTELGVNVVAADIDPNRAASATAFGAGQTMVVPTDGPFIGPEDEVSLVIEATGVPSSMVNAIHLVSHAGRIVQVGISQRDIPVPIKELTFKELDILGSRNSLALIPQGLAAAGPARGGRPLADHPPLRHRRRQRRLRTHARPHRVRRQGRRPTAHRCSLKGTNR